MLKSTAAIAALILSFSSLAHAELSESCKYNLRVAHQENVHLKQMINSISEFSDQARQRHLETLNGLIISTVALCVELKNVELQRSFFGKLHLISSTQVERIDQRISEEAAAGLAAH